uniref:Uncharacterized protein n=1 Tax=Tetranychus urticae TaxID=32264 RepID=T1L1T6_TETUR
MDVRDKIRKSLNDANEPVYRTPNPGFSPSLPCTTQLSTSSVTSPSPSSVPPIPSFNPELFKDISGDYLKSILASANSTPQIISSHSSGISSPSSNDVPYLTRQLAELFKREEDIYRRRKDLETQLAELRAQENDLFNQRSFLVKRLEWVVKSKPTSPPANTSPVSLSPSSRLSTTIIESVESEPSAYRPPAITESNTQLTKKRPGPASKTCPPNPPISSPITSSTPLSQTKTNLFKKPRIDNDSNKKPVTSGVKQSRPQPMRARKRTAPVEEPSASKEQRSGAQLKTSQPPQPPQPSANQSISTKSAQEKQKSSALSSKPDQQKSNSPKDIPKAYTSSEPIVKVKKEPTSKKSEPNKVAKDDHNENQSDSTTGESNDDACSDSDIFVALGRIKTESSSVNVASVKIEKVNIKTEPKDK